jgi:hypothetical protein
MKNPSNQRDHGHGHKRDPLGVTVPKRDDVGDRIPNDWLEAAIIFMALMSMISAGSFLYHLSQQ